MRRVGAVVISVYMPVLWNSVSIIAQADCFIFAIVYMIELIHTFAKRHDKYVAIFRTSSCPADVYLGETVDLFGHRQPNHYWDGQCNRAWFHHTIRQEGPINTRPSPSEPILGST